MHAIFVKRALPSAVTAGLPAGGVPKPTTTLVASLLSAKRGEKLLTYSTTAHPSSPLTITFPAGIGVPATPSDPDRNTSTSVGNWPVGVERNRNFASTKLRGFGSRNA